MKISRRNVLKITGFGIVATALLPRVAFASRNSLRSLRTGAQPGNKTRLVIETSARPSYSLSYPTNQLIVSLSNTTANTTLSPKLGDGTLVKTLTQVQNGDKLQIVANLRKPIDEIKKSAIMVLEPNGDSGYRLVLDFVAGTGAVPAKSATASSVASQYGTYEEVAEPVSVTKTKTTPTQPQKKTETVSAPQKTKSKKYIIVIDAGHGGKDPGCIGKGGTREKDVVLSVAKKLKTQLDKNGFQTHLTRSGDTYLKLAQRAEIAERKKADLFISLHANANPSRKMKGFSIYTLSEKASDEEAKKLAEAENAADKIGVQGFTEFEENIRIALSSLQQHAVAEMSEEYANGCAKYFKRADIEQQPGPDVRHAPFAVLRSTVPGALLELGHLSNSSEEKLLKTSKHQDKLVSAIVKSVKNYNFDV